MAIYRICSLLTSVVAALTVNVWSQVPFSVEQKESIAAQTLQRISEFQERLSVVGNKSAAPELRSLMADSLLQLCIGEGDAYDYYDETLDQRIHCPGVTLGISNGTSHKRQRLKTYVQKVCKGLMPYNSFSIGSTSILAISEIHPVNDHYECIAYFQQNFDGFKDGQTHWSGATVRKIRCVVQHITQTATDSDFVVKLGDIEVLNPPKVR